MLIDPLRALLDDFLELGLVAGAQFAAHTVLVGELAPEAVDEGRDAVEGLGALLVQGVLLREFLALLDHLLDLLLGETALVVGDGDLLALSTTRKNQLVQCSQKWVDLLINLRSLVLGADSHDGVGVELEGDLNLGDTLGRRGNAGKVELSEEVVELGLSTLALKDLDVDDGLVISSSGEAKVTRNQ